MNRNGRLYFFILLLVGLVSLWGCPKKTEVTSTPEAQKESAKAPADVSKEATKETAKHETKPAESSTAPERSAMSTEGLKPIYFDFDKSLIRHDAKAIMKANAEWLKANPGVKVKIEGNCDERGTVEYNQALGQRRATSAKKYMTDLGVSGRRISLISYGKEKPVCSEHDEACWQKNRRDEFVPER